MVQPQALLDAHERRERLWYTQREIQRDRNEIVFETRFSAYSCA